ncbi:MAG: hypothetical protein KF780_05355 [Sphingomonas sp.]|nr:hypothetical protein [Sphingomonas sp.]
MRLAIGIGSVSVIVLLAACGPGSAFDNSFRESYREKAVEGCVQGSRAAAAPAGVDFQRICECAVDRHMTGKSARDLMNEGDDVSRSGAQDATMQCIREIVPGAAAMVPGGNAPPVGDGGAKPAP